jgi:hypothetical protein
MNLTASTPIENSPPTAPMGADKPLGIETPVDHRSGPLTAIGCRSFHNRHGRSPSAGDPIGGFTEGLVKRLDALCHTVGT